MKLNAVFLVCALSLSSFAQPIENDLVYVCIKDCMAYKHGSPRPVMECPYGQLVKGKVDSTRKYLTWNGRLGSYYADLKNFMLKSDLDAVHERVLLLQSELIKAKQNEHQATLKAAETAPKTVTGTMTDDYGYTYTYRDRLESEGHDEAKAQAKSLEKSIHAIEVEIAAIKKRWSSLLFAAGYSIAW